MLGYIYLGDLSIDGTSYEEMGYVIYLIYSQNSGIWDKRNMRSIILMDMGLSHIPGDLPSDNLT